MIICSIEGCGKEVVGRGWCSTHWYRWRHHGDPLGGGTSRGGPERYLREVALAYDGNECLTWPFYRNPKGYGTIRRNGRPHIVSRIICEEANGLPPTPQHQAAHSCGNGHLGCVTKRHLVWKTQVENEADKLIHGTSNRGSRCGTAKLNEGQVLEIRSLLGRMSQREIGKRFGINQQAVSNIAIGKTWVHLTEVAA